MHSHEILVCRLNKVHRHLDLLQTSVSGSDEMGQLLFVEIELKLIKLGINASTVIFHTYLNSFKNCFIKAWLTTQFWTEDLRRASWPGF